MKYVVHISASAKKALGALPKATCSRIDRAILALADDPRPPMSRKIAGSHAPALYRIRAGDYRIVYQVRDDVLTVLVIRVGHRREIYRDI